MSRREKSRSRVFEGSKERNSKDKIGEDEERGAIGRYRLLERGLEVRRKVHW